MHEANLVAAIIALGAAFFVPVRSSSAGPAIVALCLATGTWSLAATGIGGEPGAVGAVSVASASAAAAAALVVARRLVHGAWRIPPLLFVVFLVEPLLIALTRLTRFAEAPTAEFRASPEFAFHSLYCFGLLAAVLLTLNARQRDPEQRVRIFVVASQAVVISIIASEVAMTPATEILAVVGAVFVVWVARHPEDWAGSASRADRLLNSIGIFLFVFENGILRDWNGPGAQLAQLVTGRKVSRGMTARDLLGRDVPFDDHTMLNLSLQSGTMRTVATIHAVDPTARAENREWVVMLRPVRSSVGTSSFEGVSGSLEGYDPATQTFGRRATLSQLRSAASADRSSVVRVDVTPLDRDARQDEIMFVVARRLEAIVPDSSWGRLGPWAFAAILPSTIALRAKRTIDHESEMALGLRAAVTSTVLTPTVGESDDAFLHRVDAPVLRTGTADA